MVLESPLRNYLKTNFSQILVLNGENRAKGLSECGIHYNLSLKLKQKKNF